MSKEIKYLQQKIKSQEKYIDDNFKQIGKTFEDMCSAIEINHDNIKELTEVVERIV
jgi:hypothetical protein